MDLQGSAAWTLQYRSHCHLSQRNQLNMDYMLILFFWFFFFFCLFGIHFFQHTLVANLLAECRWPLCDSQAVRLANLSNIAFTISRCLSSCVQPKSIIVQHKIVNLYPYLQTILSSSSSTPIHMNTRGWHVWMLGVLFVNIVEFNE